MRTRKVSLILALIFSVSISFFSSPLLAGYYGQEICHSAGFHCLKIRHDVSWEDLWPNAHDRNIVKRVNRMNTYLYPGIILAVPDDLQNSTVMDYAPFAKQIEAPGEKVVIIDPILRAWGAYTKDGTLLRWGPASLGRDYCKDIDGECRTYEGSFRIFSLGSSDCYSKKFPLPDGGAPMPYCMYFSEGQAIHGEPNGLPGYNDSHGCVRLYVNDAEWLRYDFVEGPSDDNDYRGTRVVVKPYE